MWSRLKTILIVSALTFFSTASLNSAHALYYGIKIEQSGQPGTNFFLNDNDTTDLDTDYNFILFSSNCVGCPSPLIIGDYTVTKVSSSIFGTHVGVLFRVDIEGSTSSATPSALTVSASAGSFVESWPGAPDRLVKAYTAFWAAPGDGHALASVDARAWLNPSSTPFGQEILLPFGATKTTLVNGTPFSVTQEMTIYTDNPGDFTAQSRLYVQPVPAALPLMVSAFAAIGFLRLRRRSAA